MSTSYRLTQIVSKQVLLDSLKGIGVSESVTEQTGEESFCISDGESYLWCYMTGDRVVEFCRYGANYNAESFLVHAADELQCEYLSEYDDDYWESSEDYDTEEV